MHYCQIYKNIYTIFLNDGNVWQLVANSPKPGKSQRKYTVTHVVTRASYGNVLHYGLSMFVEFSNVW